METIKLLTVKEAAVRLRVCNATVYKYIREKNIHALQLAPNGAIRIPEEELEKLLSTDLEKYI